MIYTSLEQCLNHLEQNRQLVRIKEEVDPFLEMAAIHLRVFESGGPALLFENIKGTKYRAASNIFGTVERSKLIFDSRFNVVKQMIEIRKNPLKALKHPLNNISLPFKAISAIPLKNPISKPVLYEEIKVQDLPLIHHWIKDGGAFVTLPQVYTEDPDDVGIMKSNLGMYRIQLTGNEYLLNKEIGLHYQLHRGIGVHQTKANRKNIPLKVSVFVGGPPAHSLAAVMPLPEGMSEVSFAGLIGGRRFRYFYKDGFCISSDADFVITGEVHENFNKPEGPFGDHLGYYSLQHPFPVLKIHKIYAKKRAIWTFTVVGRPPQEDTAFGNLIHELTGNAIEQEIPGLKEVHAVDAAGVHPLLLAVGSERYTPYSPVKKPAEILTIANHILGTGQLSLAKFLFITADNEQKISAKNIPDFFEYFFKRIDLTKDVHFYTNTTIDTLDYSGENLNRGSKVVLASYGDVKRELANEVPALFKGLNVIKNPKLALLGIVCIETNKFTDYLSVKKELQIISDELEPHINSLNNCPLIVLCDNADFVSANINNFLWATFTRCNPSHDIHGIKSYIENKHWGCSGPLIIDARIKPHHAPIVEKDKVTEAKIDRIFSKGGSLYGVF